MSALATARDVILYFADYEHCHEFMASLRWPDRTVTCPMCGAEKVTYLARNRVWKCYANHPRPRFSLKTGTIFEGSCCTASASHCNTGLQYEYWRMDACHGGRVSTAHRRTAV
jgi:hypothetical protein